MSSDRWPQIPAIPIDIARRIDATCDELERALKQGAECDLEDYLGRVNDPYRPALLRQLLLLEWEYREQVGATVDVCEYTQRFPPYATLIRETGEEFHAASLEDSAEDIGGAGLRPLRSGELFSQSWAELGYLILGRLADGAAGTVFMASQTSQDRLVAVKVLRHGQDAAALHRFQREVQSLERLRHPNIVPILEVGQFEGRPFYAMEYCSGGSLADVLPRRRLNVHESATLVETLARAVHVAHQANIVHRDLKPSNVLLQEDASLEENAEQRPEATAPKLGDFVPKIADFGLAKELDRTLQTQIGAVVGTPQYMAPEQAQGDGQSIGAATDVHALGAILYECLTGRAPFVGSTVVDTIRRVIVEDPKPPTRHVNSIPIDLETICLKCLRKSPSDRYPHAVDLADDLRRFKHGEPIQARPIGVSRRTLEWTRKHTAAAALVCVLALCGTIGPIIAVWAWKERATALAAEKSASVAAAEANRQMAHALFARALADGDVRGPEVALLWLARSMHAAVQAGDHQLVASTRAQLGAWRRNVRSLRNTINHPEKVYDVAWNSDARWIVTAGVDGTARVWNISSGKQALPPLQHEAPVRKVAISPDDQIIVTGGDDRAVRMWSASTGLQMGRSLQHDDAVTALGFGPQGDFLVTGSRDGIVRRWSTASSTAIGQPLHHTDVVHCVDLSPNGSAIITGCNDGGARIWDVATGKPMGPTIEHLSPVLAVCFSPDGRTVLTGTRRGIAQLWDVETGAPLGPSLPHWSWVNDVCFSPDGKTLLTTSRDRNARFWDATTGTLQQRLEHDGQVTAGGFSHDAKFVATTSVAGTARIWDVPEVTRLDGRHVIVFARFTPDGSTVRGGRAKWDVVSWNVADGRRTGITSNTEDWDRVLTVSHSGGLVLVSTSQGELRLCDVDSGEPKTVMLHPECRVGAFSRNDRLLLTGGRHNTARVWDTATGHLVCPPLNHASVVSAVALSDDGKRALTAVSRGGLQLWDTETGQPIGRSLLHRSGVVATAFSPDGSTIVSATFNGLIHCWDSSTFERKGAPMRHNSTVWSLDFSPDGSTLVTGSEDGTARLWETATGLPLGPALRHQAAVRAVAFCPLGKNFLTASKDGVVQVWPNYEPVAGTPEQITLQTQIVTRMELDDQGFTQPLDSSTWHSRKQRLRHLQNQSDLNER